MRSGVRLGIDVGKARVGVSRSDFHGMLAMPVETIKRQEDLSGTLARVLELIGEYEATEVVVGLPLNLQGESTPSTEDALGFAHQLDSLVNIGIRLVDERLSTVSAQSVLHGVGRSTKSSRPVIDQVAAVIILQQALDVERSLGHPPGRLVEGSATQQGKFSGI
ncbi:Holliday junction resolvase RuvX [Lysinibacter sp. HNR]|uniref:Holliday junction resolvase RuvX n=1 Tax=Lysinibacter sp. HNR TaxID=3031408 RepID=UPI002435485E|nr:Holliday junction resolvase RuvX [Lysinibacter sp. HNR]WGD36296.1 Holliday junction resolvase RuvX [Lysinibacter sp. HNR]